MSEYIPDAELHFADARPSIETRVEILDNGWVKLPDEDELHPPSAIRRVDDQL